MRETPDMHSFKVRALGRICNEGATWARSTQVVADGLAKRYQEPNLRRILAGDNGEITADVSSPVRQTYLLKADGTAQLLPPPNERIRKA